jgi:hypothetical protein
MLPIGTPTHLHMSMDLMLLFLCQLAHQDNQVIFARIEFVVASEER